jgi:hypothetical protein
MQVEEEGLREFQPGEALSVGEVVQEGRRVMVKEILFDLQRRETCIFW